MSNSDSLSIEVLSRLGEIAQSVGIVQGQNLLILDEQKNATTSRQRIHDKIDGLKDEIAGVKARVGVLELEQRRIAPLVDQHEGSHQQKVGVRRFFRKSHVAGAAVFSAGAGAWHQWGTIKEYALKLLKMG